MYAGVPIQIPPRTRLSSVPVQALIEAARLVHDLAPQTRPTMKPQSLGFPGEDIFASRFRQAASVRGRRRREGLGARLEIETQVVADNRRISEMADAADASLNPGRALQAAFDDAATPVSESRAQDILMAKHQEEVARRVAEFGDVQDDAFQVPVLDPEGRTMVVDVRESPAALAQWKDQQNSGARNTNGANPLAIAATAPTASDMKAAAVFGQASPSPQAALQASGATTPPAIPTWAKVAAVGALAWLLLPKGR